MRCRVRGSTTSPGARLATRYLLDLGHRTVHHVAGPDDWPEASERLRGWREALQEAGLPIPAVLSGDWSARAGYEQGQRLAADPCVTAVFCASDQLALGVLRALHEAGRRVPEDVSVVGFDGGLDGAHYLPPLTTVRQDFAELGRLSLGLLLSQLEQPGGSSTSRRQLLVPELVIRRSTAPSPDPCRTGDLLGPVVASERDRPIRRRCLAENECHRSSMALLPEPGPLSASKQRPHRPSGAVKHRNVPPRRTDSHPSPDAVISCRLLHRDVGPAAFPQAAAAPAPPTELRSRRTTPSPLRFPQGSGI